jgi:nucleoside-diphosphate-sugar epimerase
LILVTGASGVIGKEVCKQLDNLVIPYLSMTGNSSADKSNSVDLSVSNLDLRFLDIKPSAIIHLAAIVPHHVGIIDNYQNSQKTRAIDSNVFNLQRKFNCPIVYISSCGLYSRSKESFHKEIDVAALKPTTPYFEAKKIGEYALRDVKNSVVLRLSAPVSAFSPKNLVFSQFITASQKALILNVYGQGTREQDYITAHDAACAIVKVLLKERFGTFNLCSSNPITMLELANRIQVFFGKGYNYKNSIVLSFIHSKFIQFKLRGKKFDYIFAPAASTEVAFLKTNIPIIFSSL